MTGTRSFLDIQLDCLRQSMLMLDTLCVELSLDPQLAGTLNRLSSQLGTPSGQPSYPLGLGEALETVPQARASLDLLAAAGHLAPDNSKGLAPRLRSMLDDIEMGLGKEVRRGLSTRVYGLYVIIDPEVTGGRDPLEVALGVLKGGAKMLQLRDKLREKGEILLLARKLKEACAEHDALFIVNDHPDLALIVGADGLHVGQGDLPVAETRRILKPQQIVGRSNHLLEEVLESQAQGADHVALGPVYPTTTKARASGQATTGPDAVRTAKEVVNVPLIAIGGINEENLEPVVKAGANAVCVTSAVGLARDPEAASRCLVERILRAGGKA